MLIVSIGLAMQGGIPYIVSATTYPFYMATPENGWQHAMWPVHPPLAAPQPGGRQLVLGGPAGGRRHAVGDVGDADAGLVGVHRRR